MTIIYFIIALGILVLVHEWGHFIVARKLGIRVLKFSIGFGPKIFGVKKGETEYRVSLIPLGGYVQLFGEDPEAEAHGDAGLEHEILSQPDAFSAKPLPSRFATVLAGPMMNLVLAFFFMPIAFMIGRQVPVFMDKPPVIMGVQPGSPAFLAGLQKGDRILSINKKETDNWENVLNWVIMHADKEAKVTLNRNGKNEEFLIKTGFNPNVRQKMGYWGVEPFYFWGDDPIVGGFSPSSEALKAGLKIKDKITAVNGQPVSSWTELTQVIRASEGKALILDVNREGKALTLSMTPKYDEGAKAWLLGITKFDDPELLTQKRYEFFSAFKEGTRENLKLAGLTGQVVGQLVTFQLSYKTLGGPVQIAQATAAAARTGWGDLVYFLAFLSLQLGIMNLLPIPVLDGGHLFFMAIEGIRRRPVSLKIRSVSQQVGLVLLLTLMVLVTFNDIESVWGFGKIWQKITGIF